ncbi:MAG: serpin family protein [Chloroflexi bacterium]|nr:serpin family protein [Chloroflexota bacterium]
MKRIISFVLAVLLLGLSACAQPAAAEVVRSDKPRVTAPAASKTDLATQVDGNSIFAFNLYQVLRETDGNLFYSPHSISVALAMTYAGARGDTLKQMADTLHFILGQDKLHGALNALDQELARRGEGAKGKDEKGFRLNVVNAIWGQKDYKFLSQFLDVLAENYGAGLRVLDFIKAPEPSRITINKWVEDETEGRIKDLIPQGAINDLTRLVLTNAIYFNAAWLYPFNKEATANLPFILLNGSQVSVPMMRQTKSYGYAAGDTYQAVELLYDGRELSMVILLPNSGQFASFEKSLDVKLIKEIIGKLGNRQVALTMPKFEFDSTFNLKKTLTAMGMGIAFDPDAADFSGMTGNRELYISDVLHKAFVSVDEAGTEAAAATAVIVGTTSLPAEPITVTIDRPFIFLIRDIPAGEILFVGRVLNPAK